MNRDKNKVPRGEFKINFLMEKNNDKKQPFGEYKLMIQPNRDAEEHQATSRRRLRRV